MERDEILARMAALGLTQSDLARRLGIDQTKLSKSLKGTRRFTVDEMDQLREVLRDPSAPAVGTIPIIGLVAAGNWREAVRRPIGSMPRLDPSMPPRAFALKVDGDSMDLLVDDGATVVIDPDDKDLFPGRYYVVLNGDGEATFKEFRVDPARLAPCSSNPAHKDIPLDGSARYEIVGRVIWRASRM